ncbi:acyltransferase 3 [Caballeronia catudaia]|uniref:Acyltransferase 3 n=2 Tax=Caballeronia catudaia TaxID=1777136 RepID=A0A158B435_9BURK|nr:acyltransferase 3 [Caballeronia catudaia]
MVAANKNNFDFLRLTAAFMVLFAHQFALLGRAAPDIGARFDPGAIALYTFFVISGYLVVQSWIADPHVWRFVARRVLRIWPALVFTTVACAFVLGPLVSTLSAGEYFRSHETYAYFSWLRMRATFDLPGVFENLPYPRAVNGSLWSVPLEVHWYQILVVAALAGLMRHRWAVIAATLAFAVYHFGVYRAQTSEPQWTNEFGLFFCTGVCLYLVRDLWIDRRIVVALGVSAVAAIVAGIGQPVIAAWVAWPFLVIAFGTASTPFLRSFGRFGDFSYGAYVFAFPVQQTLIWATSAKWPVGSYLAVAAALTLALAFVSWHCVEKPAMRLKPRRPAQAPASPLRTLAEPLAWLRAVLPTLVKDVFRRRTPRIRSPAPD